MAQENEHSDYMAGDENHSLGEGDEDRRTSGQGWNNFVEKIRTGYQHNRKQIRNWGLGILTTAAIGAGMWFGYGALQDVKQYLDEKQDEEQGSQCEGTPLNIFFVLR